MARLGLILGDQLTEGHGVLAELDRDHDHLLMGELAEETGYVWHHGQKIAMVLAAMRHFAAALQGKGWQVHYHAFDADSPLRTFTDLVEDHCRRHAVDEILVAWPGEWRVLEEIRGWERRLGVAVTMLPDRRFLCPIEEFEQWARGRKTLRMEFFYREMRRRTGYLMDGDEPAGGQWNFDHDNRKAWDGDERPSRPMSFTPDRTTREVLDLVAGRIEHFGTLDAFDLPVTRTQARRALTHFVERMLAHFGDYQDAMDVDEPFLFHSRLAPAMNIGLLTPAEVCDAVVAAWRDGRAPINAVEGFIRQIIGWREFIRGVYWMHMPEYAERNELNNDLDLPGWYWTGETGMQCLHSAIDSTRRYAYAHHIQRLMVTGNFALLLGVVPEQICDWYLAVYADAFDWVERPNTTGMVMYADGGLFASKPYAASGNYIRRMSNYCNSCPYNVRHTVEDDGCPFNALYWDFLMRHRKRFESNHRMGMMMNNLERMDDGKKRAIRKRAEWIRRNIESL